MSRREYNWDAIAAVIAALIGLLAIFISGYTAWNVRQQTRAQVWPYLEVGESDSLPTDTVNGKSHGGTLVALNQGVGPAIVRSVEVLVDGKAQPDWPHVFSALDFHPRSFSMSAFDKTVLSPGQRLDYLTIIGHKDWQRFKSKLANDILIRACFCSTLGECWTSTLDYHHDFRRVRRVQSCSGVPVAKQFRS